VLLDEQESGLDRVLVELVDRAVPAVAHHAPVGTERALRLDVRDMLDEHDDSHPRNVTFPGPGLGFGVRNSLVLRHAVYCPIRHTGARQ
jgi:hypothetical protein